jgi:hypothetical protein
MHTFLIALSVIVAIALFVSWIASRPRGHQLHGLVNVAEGFQPAVKTYLTDAAIATRFLLGKVGSDASHVAVCGATDIPLGVIHDEAAAAELGVSVAKFGLHNEGEIAVASAAIAADALLVPAANGKVVTLPATAGTYYIIGRATAAAAADGDQVEFTPCFPTQRVVAG